MKLEQVRPNVFALTGTGQEVSALLAAARMAHDSMRGDPEAPQPAVELLEGVLRDYDLAIARLKTPDGRRGRPSADSPKT